jgi:6-phosphogluconolactonase
MSNYLLFVGSYAGEDQPGIHAFGFNPDSGALEARATYAGIANPSFLLAHPNRPYLYAVSELTKECNGRAGVVCAFRFDAESGVLEPINQQSSGGDAPCHLALGADGRWLVVSNYGSGTVRVLPIANDGALGQPTDLVQHYADSRKRPHAHSAAFAPDGRFVLVADLGIEQILVYAFDATTGKLSAYGHVDSRPGAGPRHLAFHPGGRILYAANELDSTISVYEYDARVGCLYERQSLTTLPSGVPKNRVADIHVASDRPRVFVSNRGHDSIALFDIAADGALTRATIRPCGGQWPRNFALEPSGQFMLIANQYSNEVAVLPLIDGETGLGAVAARATVPSASCVQFVTANQSA